MKLENHNTLARILPLLKLAKTFSVFGGHGIKHNLIFAKV
jgi:glutamate mutase epsilon subunit